MGMKIYIASSWKNLHAVQMLTGLLRADEDIDSTVLSFVENNHGEVGQFSTRHLATLDGKPINFDDWVWSERGEKSFKYDTGSAMESDLVIYIGPSGTDAWAEVGDAWAKGVPVYGLWAKGEPAGLMRRMVTWFDNVQELLFAVGEHHVDILFKRVPRRK
jgi:hypothetical protein